MAEQQIAWVVHTHEHKERTPDWYWAAGLLSLVVVAISLFFGNLLLAAIIILGVGSISVLAMRGPRTHWVRVDSRGLSLDGTMYRWSSVNSFWIEPGSANPRLLLATSGLLHPQLIIPIEDETRAQNLRSYLKRFVEEEEQDPHVGEHLAEMFGL